MNIISAAAVIDALAPGPLVDALARMFRDGCIAPVRHAHTIPVAGEPAGTALLMPAWQTDRYLGIKIVNVFPGNSARSQPAVSAIYILMSARTGALLATIDGRELTGRRTAATSTLAARYLARHDARSLLVVGTGHIARELAEFHAALRPGIRQLTVWGRTPHHAQALADALRAAGLPATATDDLESAARTADVISCATITSEPLLRGEWIRPGTHIDLVGGFRPTMREADDALIARADVFVDTRAGALQEAGDVVQPIAAGVLAEADVHELADLCSGRHPGRRSPESITVFKSVGAALEDLAAAILIYESTPQPA